MQWEVVKLGKTTEGRKNAFASVGRGKIDFNATACLLLGNYEKYKYAQFLKGKNNGKIIVGVKFLIENEEDSVEITRKRQKGKLISGMSVANKGTVQDLFGAKGTFNGTTRYNVTLDKDNNNILIISVD